jgi:hypothetical protein
MDSEQEFEEELERILHEPATGSRGQGGLPVTGSVVDYEISYTKVGRKYLIKALTEAHQKAITAARLDENYRAGVINEQFGGTGKGTTDVAMKLSERRAELKQREGR